jgi:hypothetical protein
MTKRRSMPYEAPNQGGLNIRPGKPIKSGMGGEIKSGTGTTVRSRSFGDAGVTVKPSFNEADIARVDRDMRDEPSAAALGMELRDYQRASDATKKPARSGNDENVLNLAKGGLVRDLGGNDHMNTSRGVDRMPAYVKHSKR